MAPDKGATRSVVGWFWLCAFSLSVLCVLCRAREGGREGWDGRVIALVKAKGRRPTRREEEGEGEKSDLVKDK